MAQARRAHRCLAHRGERLGKKGCRVFARSRALAQRVGECAQLGVVFLLDCSLKAVDGIDDGLVALELFALAHREKLR